MPRSPLEVLPKELAAAIESSPLWFVIGGQAVRCFAPYRPSRDADLGVTGAKDMKTLLAQLRRRGRLEVLERSADTTHLRLGDVAVSIFVLPELAAHVEGRVLTVTGILATKTHAILDRGARRDFFDLYVMLQLHGLGLVECIEALGRVHAMEINHGLVLRALAYFDDAEGEPPLPGEGEQDWHHVKQFFSRAVAALIVPPTKPLKIQSNVVDVNEATPKPSPARKKRGPKRGT